MSVDLIAQKLFSKIKHIGESRRLAREEETKSKSIGEALEKRLEDAYGVSFSSEVYSLCSYSSNALIPYVSSLLMLDMLDTCFNKSGIELPQNLSALDIGTDDWHYVNALYSFLKVRSKSEEVRLEGIEFFGYKHEESVKKRANGLKNVVYMTGDFFEMDVEPSYDIVFAMHPLAIPEAYEKWGVPFRQLNEFWERAMGMVKPGGILFGCCYLWNEGASALNSFPKEGRILHTQYYSLAQVIRGIAPARLKSFHDNAIMVARKF